MFSTEFSYILEAAYKEAASRKHAYFCVEHILYALLHNDEIREIIESSGGSLDELKKNLEDFFNNHVETVPDSLGEQELSEDQISPVQTQGVQNVLQRSIIQMKAAGKDIVTGKEVLIQMFEEPDCHAGYFLKKQGVTKLDVIHFVSHGVSKLPLFDNEDKQLIVKEDQKSEEGKKTKYLSRYTENLTKIAKAGELDPVIGRENELDRMIKILCRRQKNNPILVGDPGVGKTAMAAALAQKIIKQDVPEVLQNSELYVLEVGTLIAGTKFRGEFEYRLKGILKELMSLDNAIVFIDEIHTIVGAGATGTGSLDAANLLKPALASGKLRCIGSTTHDEFKKSFDKDRALSRRFSTVNLTEPSVKDTIKILEGLKKHYENYHQVKFTKEALKSAATLAKKHINDRFLPDKAIDVIDEAGAANNLLGEDRVSKITEKEIAKIVADIARVPVENMDEQATDNLSNLEKIIKAKIFGQDSAIEAVCMAIKRSRASLQDDRKPIGSFLFAGPTGVGKTELARVLAQALGVPFQRFDMSEYMEKHAVSRLVGAPPGYVGYEEGGILTDLIRKQPYAVILLDELEKAHQDVFNILLQIMDDATLTDSQGRKADFRNAIIIMTSNAGSDSSNALGFGSASGDSKRDKAIKKTFRPEFRNRLDDIVYFKPLPHKVIMQIVNKFVKELSEQLKTKKVKIKLSKAAKEYLAQNGFDDQLGARPMRRLIQSQIKDKLADEILFGKLNKGGLVHVDSIEGDISFRFE